MRSVCYTDQYKLEVEANFGNGGHSAGGSHVGDPGRNYVSRLRGRGFERGVSGHGSDW